LGGVWIRLRRLWFSCRRRPASAFAAGLLSALLLLGILSAVRINQLNAAQRELALIALPHLRRPIRQMSWYPKTWEHVRSLRGGNTSPDPQLQAQAAAALEGIDARVVKKLPGAAQIVEFDPRSERLLMVREGGDEKKTWYRTILWDRTAGRSSSATSARGCSPSGPMGRPCNCPGCTRSRRGTSSRGNRSSPRS
jgi:hypothetical protein